MRVVQPDLLVIEHSHGSYGLFLDHLLVDFQEDLGKSSQTESGSPGFQNSPRVIPSIDGCRITISSINQRN